MYLIIYFFADPFIEGVALIGDKLNITCEISCEIPHLCKNSLIKWYKDNIHLTYSSTYPGVKLANQWYISAYLKKLFVFKHIAIYYITWHIIF